MKPTQETNEGLTDDIRDCVCQNIYCQNIYVTLNRLVLLNYLTFVLTVGYFSVAMLIDSVLSIVNPRIYLTNQLRKQGVDLNGLSIVLNSLVLSRLTYACQAFSVLFYLNLTSTDCNLVQIKLACGNYVQLGI